MSREIINKPHPTPNPDGPHAGNANHGTADVAGPSFPQQDESRTQEPADDARFDDLNVIMAETGVDLDLALNQKSSSDVILSISTGEEPGSSLHAERETPPRTSEIFQSIGPGAADAGPSTAVAETSSAFCPIEIAPDLEPVFDQGLFDANDSNRRGTPAPRGAQLGSEDDPFVESRLPWALLFLMSYSSAVTLALTWVVWTGRTLRPAGAPSASTSPADTEPVPRIVSSAPIGALPPLPAENLASLGQAVQIGHLEVTPLAIKARPVVLVRSIDSNDWRREESPSLVVQLRLKNVSSDQEFAPLERRFVREQTAALDRSAIVTSQGKAINLFPLAMESEWSIEGQAFTVLKPGETMETVIASEPGVIDKLTDESIWRIRLRIGTFRTDVLGVRFNKHEIEEEAPE